MSARGLLLTGLAALALSAVACAASSGRENLRLPHIIGDHMVLQQEMDVPIWGWAGAGARISVEIDRQVVRTTADEIGKWLLKLKPMKAGGPHEMMIGDGATTIRLADVMVGEVWLCSGQSNMQWPLNASSTGKAALAAADLPNVRLFNVPVERSSGYPIEDVNANWQRSTAGSAARFSAVAWFFAREIHREQNVPVGVISTAWSGTRIDAWTPPEGFASVPELPDAKPGIDRVQRLYRERIGPRLDALDGFVQRTRSGMAEGGSIPIVPPTQIPPPVSDLRLQVGLTGGLVTELYNSMIYPLKPFGIRGVCWYQGESNVTAYPFVHYGLPDGGMWYFHKTRALVQGWRAVWGQGNFPFYSVQLAPHDRYREGTMPLLREAQVAALRIPNTGMIVTTDIGDVHNIHPRNKETVGKRLALIALAKTYGREGVVFSGPLYKDMAVEGNRIRIAFDHVAGGLAASDDKPLTWFIIAGKDRKFVEAEATIDGETVVVRSGDIPEPVAVRFGWSHLAVPNLVNKSGLPASQFRTDDWPFYRVAPADREANLAAGRKFLAENGQRPGVKTLASGLQYEVLADGEGPHPQPNNQVKFDYVTRTLDGTITDSSEMDGEPATPPVDRALPALNEALQLMKPGAKWRLFIPGELAYGDTPPHPGIGPCEALVMDVELIEIMRAW